MKNTLFILVLSVLISACEDGDVDVSDSVLNEKYHLIVGGYHIKNKNDAEAGLSVLRAIKQVNPATNNESVKSFVIRETRRPDGSQVHEGWTGDLITYFYIDHIDEYGNANDLDYQLVERDINGEWIVSDPMTAIQLDNYLKKKYQFCFMDEESN